jgi:hypothetical protein
MLIAARSSQDFHQPQQCANQWTDGAVALCSPMDMIARLTFWLMIAGTCSLLRSQFSAAESASYRCGRGFFDATIGKSK